MKLHHAALTVLFAWGCSKAEAPVNRAEAEPEPGSREWKVRNARSAAPPMVAMGAMVLDIRDTTYMAFDTLERGTEGNGWVCMADDRNTNHNDPICLDDQAMRFYDAFVRRQRPQLTGMGVAYALQGAAVASDTDPMKMQPDSGWLMDGPSIYLAMPTAAAYAGIPTTRRANGPWVRYSGTPYAYIVVPAGQN